MRHRKVKKLAQIYIPSKGQTWDENPGDRRKRIDPIKKYFFLL